VQLVQKRLKKYYAILTSIITGKNCKCLWAKCKEHTLPKIGLLLKNCNCQEGFFWGTAKKDLV
jgi:hypothetical protein